MSKTPGVNGEMKGRLWARCSKSQLACPSLSLNRVKPQTGSNHRHPSREMLICTLRGGKISGLEPWQTPLGRSRCGVVESIRNLLRALHVLRNLAHAAVARLD
ncbi:hypothetical protein [Leptolyngbya sp. O-77]|uniref:hypothetical protein n=1 Tax=Leptolyngbya sp. O-77 TaxID=1080068 RepID=UPI0012E36739|nr:hypothetical protein [Leptolyngbya sp. O-77]